MAQLTAVHDGFLQRQSALHNQFLATRTPGPDSGLPGRRQW